MKKYFSSLEDLDSEKLEVFKVYVDEKETSENSDFDNLYKDLKTKNELPPPPPSEVTPEPVDEPTDEPSDDSSPDKPEDMVSDDDLGDMGIDTDTESKDDASDDKESDKKDEDVKEKEDDKSKDKDIEEDESKDKDKDKDKDIKDDTKKDDIKDDGKEKDAIESFNSIYNDDYIAIEDSIFTKDGAINAVKTGVDYTGKALSLGLDVTKYLGFLGIKYLPIIARKVNKGVIFAVGKTAKGIYVGNNILKKFNNEKINNIKSYKGKINKLRLALMEYEKIKDRPTKDSSKLMFNNVTYIGELKIGKSYEFDKNALVLLKLLDSLNSGIGTKVNEHINGINSLVKKLTSNHFSSTFKLPIDTLMISDMSKRDLESFKPTVDTLDTLVYNYILPGDGLLIAYVPKKDLIDETDLDTAYEKCSMFVGVDIDNNDTMSSVQYLDISKVKMYLDTLDKICDHALFKTNLVNSITKSRNSLNPNLRSYLDYMYESPDKISLKDSMAKSVSNKMKFVDKTYISGLMHVETYSLKYLNASTQYIMALIKSNS